MKEKDLQKQIRDYLMTLERTFAFRVEQRPGLGHGVSDILGVFQGRFLAIEVKLPGNRTTPLQERFLRMVRSAGGIGYVAYSLENLKNFLCSISKD